MKRHRKKISHHIRTVVLLCISGGLIIVGIGALWVATLQMPDLDSFESRTVTNSTKIYDRTGTILLYDTGINAKRTFAPLSEISPLIPKAAIAIEDSNFYTNIGIEPTSIVRALLADIASGGYGQGASTITQQVVKNSLLTQDKTISRKIKEWILAIKITKVISKDKILETYLNETPYGGTIYGVEEASRAFFGKSSKEVSLAQASYLAAIPQAPTYYSPYGTHRDSLDNRRKLVLGRMKELGTITQGEYDAALKEKVEFLSKNDANIRAPHFVMFVRDYITQKYGEDALEKGGMRVITTLNYDLQQKAEAVVTKFAPTIEQNYNASNTAMVAIDPKNGDILTMVGSRDYFSKTIEGNFNVALAKRQPGSTFKPFVYATAFKKGYTPETVLFDVETEFSTLCDPDGKPKNPTDDPEKVCYKPKDYDSLYPGPLTIRQALAQSRNIPAVKALYLAGINNSIQTAQDLGITSLNDPDRYGLTLVLGGGEVSLLDMTSAYSVFANDGTRNPYRSVLKIEDSKGIVLEEAETKPIRALAPEIARQISSILSDNNVRLASMKPIADSIGRTVAIKTGTTNDYRDVWVIGYTPNLAVGAWAGKNDNTPLQHNIAGLIISPLWGAFVSQAVKDLPLEDFKTPPTPLTDNKPVLRGIWQGGVSYKIDTISGKVATEYTPPETEKDITFNNVHTILQWVDKTDPRGSVLADPTKDSQYPYWEYGVRKWVDAYKVAHPEFKETDSVVIPTEIDSIHTPDKVPNISITSPSPHANIDPQQLLTVSIKAIGAYPIKKTELYINGKYILTKETDPLNISFIPRDIGLSSTNTLSVIVYDEVFNRAQTSLEFSVTQ